MDVQKDPTLYDDAKDHFLGNFPDLLPIEQAYVHIGIYLGWIIEAQLYSDFFAEEASNQIFRFRRREISCTILSEIWNGYLGDDLLSARGKAFTDYYYAGGLYLRDFNNLLARSLPSRYHVTDSWANYWKMKTRVDERFDDWMKSHDQPS